VIDKQLDEYGCRTIKLDRDGPRSYRGYFIKPKQDFGARPHVLSAFPVEHGYIVTDGGIINVMPGATWFQSVGEAMRAIDDLIRSEGDERISEHPFWARDRFRRQAEEHAPELALALQAALDRLGPDAFQAIVGVDVLNLLNQIDDNCDTRTRVGMHPDPYRRLGERTSGRFGLPK
jgi:hypothetical protein